MVLILTLWLSIPPESLTWPNFSDTCVLPGSEKAGWKGHTSLVWTAEQSRNSPRGLLASFVNSGPQCDWTRWCQRKLENFLSMRPCWANLSSAMSRFRDASGTLIKQSLKFKVQTCVSYTCFIRILPDRLCRKYGGKKKVMWLLRHTKLATCISFWLKFLDGNDLFKFRRRGDTCGSKSSKEKLRRKPETFNVKAASYRWIEDYHRNSNQSESVSNAMNPYEPIVIFRCLVTIVFHARSTDGVKRNAKLVKLRQNAKGPVTTVTTAANVVIANGCQLHLVAFAFAEGFWFWFCIYLHLQASYPWEIEKGKGGGTDKIHMETWGSEVALSVWIIQASIRIWVCMSCLDFPGRTAATIWSSSHEQRGWGRAELLCFLYFLYTFLSWKFKTRCLPKSMLFGDNVKMLLEGVGLFMAFLFLSACDMPQHVGHVAFAKAKRGGGTTALWRGT